MKRFKISTTGKKLLTQLLLFSSVITLITTCAQLYVEFNAEVDHLDVRFYEINEVLSESLTASTWAFDQNQIEKQMQGILRFQQVAEVQLAVEGFRNFSFSNDVPANGPSKKLPLVYKDTRGPHEIGLLTVTFTMEQIYGSLIQRGIVMLITNFLRTLLVSFFILYLFFRLVTKPFQDLAAKAREASMAQLDLLELTESNRTARSNFHRHDELEEMSESLALMQRSFLNSYQALKMSENRFRDIIADNFDYVFETDVDGIYSFVSSNARQNDPLKAKVVVGQSLFDLPFDDETKSALLAQAKVEVESFKYTQNGSSQLYKLSINPFYDLENKFVGYRGLITEVTEMMLRKERQEKQEDQIRHIQKIGMIGELAAGFAHDFNNILAIILGNTAILKRSVSDIPSADKALSGIQGATSRGQGLIKKIMAFSQKPGGEIQPEDLGSVIHSMLPLIKVAVSNRNKVVLEIPDDLWRVRVDVGSFENVVINLAINARDAMPEGGTLTISLSNTVIRDNTDSCVAGDYVAMVVSDTGTGIPTEVQAKIFEPFFTTKQVGHGTGLGLSTVSNFVQQSYGCIFVASELGKGAAFTVYLPRFQEQDEAPTNEAKESQT